MNPNPSTNSNNNNNNNTLIWILIIILILISLHFIILWGKNNSNSKFTNQPKPKNNKNDMINDVRNDKKNINISDKRFVLNNVINNNDNDSVIVFESNSYDDYVDGYLDDNPKTNTNPPYDFFDINNNDDDSRQRNAFLDEYTKYTRFDKKTPKEFSNKDIDKHREDYLDFHDKINMTTSGFDQVDRINLAQLNNPEFNCQNNNKSIAEIYDNLVGGVRPKYNNNEIKDFNTKSLTFEYSDDPKYKVNNFYNGLENYNYSNYGYNGFI
jgi:hypothetical protein